MRVSLRSWVLVLGVGAAGVSRADRSFPAEIRRHLSACATPVCTVCHQTLRGGKGTATKPFAVTMQDIGLTGDSSLSQLRNALNTVSQNGTDSDGDGFADIPELVVGSSPSDAAVTPPPDGGCLPGGGGTSPDGGVGSGDGGAGSEEDPVDLEAVGPPVYGCSTASGFLSVWGLAALLAFVRKR